MAPIRGLRALLPRLLNAAKHKGNGVNNMTVATPSPTDAIEARLVDTIARRNIAWGNWQEARHDWIAAGAQPGPLLAAVNAAQDAYEWACRDLVRARAHLKAEQQANRCDARTGTAASAYGSVPIRCHQTVGLRGYTDSTGVKRAYCAQHEEAVRGRWPEYVSERADDPLGQAKAAAEALG